MILQFVFLFIFPSLLLGNIHSSYNSSLNYNIMVGRLQGKNAIVTGAAGYGLKISSLPVKTKQACTDHDL